MSGPGFLVMIPRMKKIAPMVRVSCVIASLFAITPRVAHEQDAVCRAPARIDTGAAGAEPAPLVRVRNYRPIFQQCQNALNQTRLAIRRMSVDAENLLLMVDPSTLETSLEHERCWMCADTDDDTQKETRLIGAVQMFSQPAANDATTQSAAFNAGLSHSIKDGSFITGDLCPSRKPLDRDLLEVLKTIGSRTPVALAISGLWLTRHGADFQWLREQARSGALEITWVNHSYHHPYVPGRPLANNFLLTPGFDIQSEILDTERLLIANGETPSIFFRFPGLVSDAALMQAVRRDHLVVLGADGWLVFAPPLRPGAILLIHPNGNEHPGLRLFVKLLDKGRLPRPFRRINDAP
ncbi:MAG: hypothetical protein USCAAHI_00587 [Beijerinckiaceae bacterium]|nr:MAG: hypothetical protein USCAAHI_00587 [Beijerinckiaceae bacterium]